MNSMVAVIVKRWALESAFVLPLVLLVAYLPEADLVDRCFFCLYVAVSTAVRIWHRKPLEAWGWLVLHLSVVLVLLSELDKLQGYPNGHDPIGELALASPLLFLGALMAALWDMGLRATGIFVALMIVVPIIHLGTAGLGLRAEMILMGVWLTVMAARWAKACKHGRGLVLSGLLAATILQLPIVESAMQVSRQLWFQTLPCFRPCVYATKVTDSMVYGVDLRDRFNVVWFDRSSAPNDPVLHRNVEGLGMGTMEAQIPNRSKPVWEWAQLKNCPGL